VCLRTCLHVMDMALWRMVQGPGVSVSVSVSCMVVVGRGTWDCELVVYLLQLSEVEGHKVT